MDVDASRSAKPTEAFINDADLPDLCLVNSTAWDRVGPPIADIPVFLKNVLKNGFFVALRSAPGCAVTLERHLGIHL